MNKAEEVIKRLDKENRTYSIKILGNKKNQENAFAILLSSTSFHGTAENVYHGIPQKTIDLLKEAEIDFKLRK